MLIEFLEDVKSSLKMYEMKSGAHVADIPLDIGSLGSLSCKRTSNELFYSFTSFLSPGMIFKVDLSG
jgi:prolyl oligopeptidase